MKRLHVEIETDEAVDGNCEQAEILPQRDDGKSDLPVSCQNVRRKQSRFIGARPEFQIRIEAESWEFHEQVNMADVNDVDDTQTEGDFEECSTEIHVVSVLVQYKNYYCIDWHGDEQAQC